MKLNNIKKSFDQRNLAPSPGSWDKLAQRLDNEQKNKKRPYLYWLGAVAAAVIIALMIIVPVFTNPVDSINDSVVKQDGKPVIENKVNTPKPDTSDENEVVDAKTMQTQENAVATQPTKTITSKKSQQTTLQTSNSQLAQSEKNNQEVKNSKPMQLNTNTNRNTAVAVQEQKETGIGSTATTKLTAAQEADLLLERAMKKTQLQTTVTSAKVDPSKLLMETQWDIEADRRNRVENILQDQFGKLKAHAVAIIIKN
jgi:hypothetical protein